MNHINNIRLIAFSLLVTFTSCQKKDETTADDVSPSAPEVAVKVNNSEDGYLTVMQSLPESFDKLSDGRMSLDEFFDSVDPASCGEKANYISRYTSSHAQAFNSYAPGVEEQLVSADTLLAKHIHTNYPMARQFYKEYDGVMKLDLRDLVERWRFIPESE